MTRLITFALILGALAANAAFAVVEIFPQAYLKSFDSETFTYIYRVSCPSDMTHPFGYLQVDANVSEEDTGPWTLSGPFVEGMKICDLGDIDLAWSNGVFPRSAEADAAYWRASREQEVLPGLAWVGDFVLVAPNTRPGEGWIYTADGVPGSNQEILDLVPCAVPEPSSLLALSAGFVSLGAYWKRRKSPKT